MADFDYRNGSYWCDTGKHVEKLKELQELIPAAGEVDFDNHLEELRQCQNAYHDLYNNGGGNRDAAILYFSGADTSYGTEGGFHNNRGHEFDELLDGWDIDAVAPGLEKEMDRLILLAYDSCIAACE